MGPQLGMPGMEASGAMHTFEGTYTALVTPFRDGQVDYATLERLVERQLAAGVDGLVPCGTTGESPTLAPGEQREIIGRVVRQARGRAKVVAGTGSNATAHAVLLSREAEELGVDGVLVVAPYYNKPSPAGLFEHYAAIARAVHVPVVVYNIPGRCGVEIPVATLVELRAAFAHVNTVKHATGSVMGASDLLAACAVTLLSGDDPLTLPLMSIGGRGVISVVSNLAPRAVKRLTDAALRGDCVEARAAHEALYPLARALLAIDTNPVPIKTALAMKGWCSDEFRLPLCPLTREAWHKLEGLLKEHPLE